MTINNIHVGYWPKEIFSHLRMGATHLQYGGWVFASSHGNSPPMGSGHLPNQDSQRSCFFRDVKFMDAEYQEILILDNKAHTYFDTTCYHVIYWGNQGLEWGKVFTFGGPGGQCGI